VLLIGGVCYSFPVIYMAVTCLAMDATALARTTLAEAGVTFLAYKSAQRTLHYFYYLFARSLSVYPSRTYRPVMAPH
jgi:hypothetical protein